MEKVKRMTEITGDGKWMNRMAPSAGMNKFLRNGWVDE